MTVIFELAFATALTHLVVPLVDAVIFRLREPSERRPSVHH
ncbi:hypothetical protein [Thiohalocapsa marina]